MECQHQQQRVGGVVMPSPDDMGLRLSPALQSGPCLRSTQYSRRPMPHLFNDGCRAVACRRSSSYSLADAWAAAGSSTTHRRLPPRRGIGNADDSGQLTANSQIQMTIGMEECRIWRLPWLGRRSPHPQRQSAASSDNAPAHRLHSWQCHGPPDTALEMCISSWFIPF